MAEKYWWLNDSQQDNGSQKKKYWWLQDSADKAGAKITDRVNTWLKNHNTYISNYQKRTSGRKYSYEDSYVGDSANWLSTISQQKSNFDAEADSILSYMDLYKDHLDKDWMAKVRDTLSSARLDQGKIFDHATKDNEWWSSFADEDQYNTYKRYDSYSKKYQGLTYSDIQKVLGELEDSEEKDWLTNNQYAFYKNDSSYNSKAASGYKSYEAQKIAQQEAIKQEEANKTWWDKAADFILAANQAASYDNPMTGAIANQRELYAEDKSYMEPNEQWSAEQKNNFGYLYSESPAKAHQYAIQVNNQINAQAEQNAQQAVGDWSSQNIGTGILGTLGAIATAPSGMADLLDNIVEYSARGTITQKGYITPYEFGQSAQSGIANKLNEYGTLDDDLFAIGGKGLGDVYSLGVSAANSLLSAYTMGGAGTLVNYIGQGGAAGVDDALSRGATAEQALLYGSIVGAAEGLTEMIPAEKLLKVGSSATLKNYLMTALKQGIGEFTEEGVSSIISNVADNIIMQDKSNFNAMVKRFMASEGLSRESAEAKAWKKLAGDAVFDAMGGFATGAGNAALVGGVSTAMDSWKGNQANIDAIKKYGGVTGDLIQEGLENDTKSDSYKLAQKYKERTDSGKALTGFQIRNLLAANKEQVTAKDIQKIEQATAERLVKLGQKEDVSKIAKLATKYVTGGELTRSEKNFLANSKNGSAVTSEMLSNFPAEYSDKIGANKLLSKWENDMADGMSDNYSSEWAANIGTESVSRAAFDQKRFEADVTRAFLDALSNTPATYKPLTDRVGTEDSYGVSESGQATNRKTGEAITLDKKVKVTKFVTDKDTGKITDMVLDVDGKEVKASEIDYEDENQSYLFSAVPKIENITPEDATVIIRDYDPASGLSVGEYLNGVDEAFTYGFHNYSEADLKAGDFAPKLGDTLSTSAYVLGQNAKKNSKTKDTESVKKMRTAVNAEIEKAAKEGKEAPKARKLTITYNHGGGVVEDISTEDLLTTKKLGKLNKLQRGGMEAVQILHQIGIGTDYEFFTSYFSKTLKDKDGNALEVFLDDNGQEQAAYAGVYMTADGKIRINLNAYSGTKGLTLNALSHELTHFIKTWSLEKYDAMADFLVKSYGEKGMSMHKLVLKEQARLKKVRGKDVGYSEAYDEVVANAFNRMLEDGKVMERIAEIRQIDKSLGDKIIECIRNFINRFFDAYRKNKSLFHETKALMDMKEVFEQLQEMFAEALVDASENFQANLMATEVGVEPIAVEDITQYSYSSLAEAAGFEAVENEDGTRSFTRDGKKVSKVTVEDIDNSPIGAFINFSLEMGDISDADSKRQKQMFADICTMACKTNDFAMTMQFVGSAVFTGMKANADKQYGTTYDFPSICTKTQAVIDAMSAKMKTFGRGLNTDEIVQLYSDVFASGNPVPCPECYVFSRWIGIGGLLDNIKKYQDYYGDMAVEDVANAYRKMKAEVSKFAEEQGISFGKAKGALTSKLTKEFNKLTEKVEKAQNQGEKVKPADLKRLEELEPMMNTVKAMTWLENVYFADSSLKKVNPKFRVPNKVLFDLNNGEAFATQYKEAWAFRTTQGAGYGKAITPYADARLGEGVLVTNNTTNAIKGKAQGSLNNYFLNQKGKLDKQSRDALKKARLKQKIQAFIGGQRFQSTSDARYENASDYLLAALEMQAMGGMVQAYTKVDGAVPAFSAWGFSINQSLMPLNGGLDADGNVKDTAVGGMKPSVAFENRKKHESAGTITIGVNDNHIRAMFKQLVRDFIIPYHASGGKADVVAEFRRIQEGKEAKGKAVRSTDYSRTQSDKVLSDEVLRWHGKTDAQIQRIHEIRNARIAILTGGKPNMTVVRSNRFLSALYDKLNGGEWGGVKLAKSKVESQIFPNEFWDQTVTYEESAKITKDYLEYCEDLGFLHRFSGMIPSNGKLVPANGYNENGERVQLTDLAYKYDENGNKTAEVEAFFWKVLTDRRMYDNNGNYLPQKVVTLNDTTVDTVADFAKNNQGRQYDKAKAEALAKKIANGEQYSSRETDRDTHTEAMHSYEGLPADAFYKNSDIYNYDFLVNQKPMVVVENVPSLSDVQINGKIDYDKVVELGLDNVKENGGVKKGDVYLLENSYTGRPLQISKNSITHGLGAESGNAKRTNARLGAAIGQICKNAIPINGVENTHNVRGTYVMASLIDTTIGGEELFIVALVNVEQQNGVVQSVEYLDVAHALSGRKLNDKTIEKENRVALSPRSGTKSDSESQFSTINIVDFLGIVNSTHQGFLSDDVVKRLGVERRGPKKGLFSSQETDLDSDGKQLSKEQQEFFKDSKVRDSNGNLLVVRHGTNEDFHIFDFTKSGKNGKAEGYGFYFSDDIEITGRYGGIQKEVYLNITKPLYNNKRTIKKVELVKLVDALIDFNLEKYKSDGLVWQDSFISNYVSTYERNMSRRYAVQEFVNQILDYNTNDQDLVFEIAQADGRMYESSTMKEFYDVLTKSIGYDGIIAEWSHADGTSNVYVTFDSEQSKYTTNKKPTADKDMRFSTQETDNITDRDMLANAFETISKSSDEYEMIQDYKSNVERLNKLEREMDDVNQEIRKIRFVKGEYNKEKLKVLESKADRLAERITKYDKMLLNMEASEPLRKVIERERKKEAQKTKDHVEEIQQNKKVRAEQTELRHKIRKAIRDLDKILKHGNKQKNVKEDLQPVVTKALQAAEILFTDNYGTYDMLRNGIGADMSDAEEALVNACAKMLQSLDKMPADGYENWQARQEAENRLKTKMSKLKDVFARERKRLNNTTVSSILGELADAYASLEKSEQSYVQGAYSEAVHNFLKSLQQDIGGTIVKDMTKNQLESVYAAYKMVLTTVRKANTMFNEELKMSRAQLGNAVIEEVRKAGGVNLLGTKLGDAISQALWNNMKPIWVANRIGSETFGKLMLGLFKGQYNFAVDAEEAKQFKLSMDEKYHPREWDAEKLYDFESSTGKPFSLNLQQIMSLYAFSKREQAFSHLLSGGFVFENNSTVIVEKDGKKKTYIHKGATSYKLNEATINEIIDSLTAEQKAYVDEMQAYLSDVMGAKGNEVSMQLYGIKMFNEKFYFPLRSSGAYMERAKEAELKKQQGQINLVNSGFTHAVKPQAKNPIILSGFMDVWAEHCNEMSMYHSMVLPMEDFRKVYNYSTVHDENFDSASVYQTIQDAYGDAATAYIDQLYRELNAGATIDPRETPYKQMISNFKKSAVMLSASVVVQQFSAIGRAFAYIDPTYFSGAKIDSGTNLSVVDEMKKYAPVAIIKEMGGFDTGTKGSAKSYIMAEQYSKGERKQALLKDEQYRSEVMGYLPAKADEKTWCAIWEAVKRETNAKHPEMDVKSEEFLKLVGERFSDVIERTQVYDSVLARSANMRSKGGLMQMATAFMAEPTTTINLLEDAIRSGNKEQMARTFGAVAVSIVLNNALASIVYAMRDDDEDETLIEKYFQSFTSGMIDDINPMTYYPFLKDVWSLFQGYDVERTDMSVIADLRDALKKTVSLLGKDTSSMDDDELAEHSKNVWGTLGSLLDAGCSVFGVPFKNIRREAKGIINTFSTIGKDLSGRTTTWNSFWDKVGSAVKDTIPGVAWTKGETKSDQLYDAIVSGDKSYAERIKATYKDESSYRSAVRKGLRDNDSRIHEAAQARVDGNIEEYKRIFKEIQKEGKFTFDDIMSAINSEESSIQRVSSLEKDYLEFAEPVGISMDVFASFLQSIKGLETKYDEWGDVEVSKRDQVLEIIDSLPLTWKQKDALYLAAGYAESKIWDVPW